MWQKVDFFMTTGDDQVSGWTEKKLQSTSQRQTWTTTKKGHGNFGDLLLPWSSTAFQILGKPQHLRSMLSKSRRCTKTAMPAASIGQQKGPNFSPQLQAIYRTINASKVEQIGLQCFTSSSIFIWPLTNHLPLQASWRLFAGKMLPQPAGGRKCFPRVHWILGMGFYSTGIKQLISCWQKYVDCYSFHCNYSYFD